MSVEFLKPVGLEKLATAAGYGLVAQCVQTYENMRTCVEAAGGAMSDVILLRTYLTDRAQRPIHSAVRRRYFPGPDFPCSTLLIVELATPELLLEVEAVAHIPLH